MNLIEFVQYNLLETLIFSYSLNRPGNIACAYQLSCNSWPHLVNPLISCLCFSHRVCSSKCQNSSFFVYFPVSLSCLPVCSLSVHLLFVRFLPAFFSLYVLQQRNSYGAGICYHGGWWAGALGGPLCWWLAVWLCRCLSLSVHRLLTHETELMVVPASWNRVRV